MKIKVALGQFNIQFAQPAANRARVRELVATAAAGNADVVVLPEMWNTGYALDALPQLADEDGRTTLALLQELARQYHIGIVGG